VAPDLASLESIRGIGEKRAKQLGQLGIFTPEDLLEYLPRDYMDYSHVTAVRDAQDGGFCALKMEIISGASLYAVQGMKIVTARARDESGEIRLTWFNQPYRRTQVKAGDPWYACGRVSRKKGVALLNPMLSRELPGILPVYPSVKGVSQRTMRDAVASLLKTAWDAIPETMPMSLLAEHTLVSRKIALRHAHFPANTEMLQVARQRLRFEQALLYQLAVHEQIRERKSGAGIAFDVHGLRERFLKKLSFSLTNAQCRVLDDLDADMQSPYPMNRLLQGDVGSGKTVVALYALSVAAANGYQGALLAPTEILAQQHFEQVQALFGDAAVLVTGSMRRDPRERALARIADGTAFCIVGTHALMQGDIQFYRLGLVVTDEQHRFGVRQRARMEEKGIRPDVLVMSATPIPRTLALLLFGDLELSVLDEMPPGRKPVMTRLVPEEKRAGLYTYLEEQAKAGVQSFVVCPFIDEPETLDGRCVSAEVKELQGQMPNARVAALHGRMPEAQKQKTVQAFRDGEIDVLVSTTLIEVGVHVPKACIMVIENAERFGLAQLHQLRGRVGRGEAQSYCFLMSSSISENAQQRLKALTESNDGFQIAEMDLRMRGAGDFIGIRQHGESALTFDEDLLQKTRRAAEVIVNEPNAEHEALLARAAHKFGAGLRQIAMN
jgi:ATP-dependent DNA helicase RecG